MDTIAILSTLNELAQLVTVSVDQTALGRLKADFSGYFRETAPGVKLSWCDGILAKNEDGSASYKSTKTGPFATAIPFTEATGIATLRAIPAIEASWQANYPGAFAAEAIQTLIDKLKILIGDGTDIQIPPVPPEKPPIILDPPSSGKIKWLTTRAEAIAAAKAQNRPIFMLAGKDSCSVTTGMRDFICELPSPEHPNASPIKALIEQHFIPWWADIDGAGHIEYEQYAPSGLFNMPLMAVIDSNGAIVPKTDAAGLAVKWIVGNKNDQVLFAWLQQYV